MEYNNAKSMYKPVFYYRRISLVQIFLNAFDTDKIYGVIHASNSDVIFMHIEHNLYMQYYSENHA